MSYRGQELSNAGEAELTAYRRHHVGFVFQFYNLIPSLTARENVALVTEITRDPMPPEEALGMVGLGERLDHFPAQLWGGEQQRVAIARVNRELGTATAVITHNAAIAAMAHRVIRLADGHVAGIERPARRLQARELTW